MYRTTTTRIKRKKANFWMLFVIMFVCACGCDKIYFRDLCYAFSLFLCICIQNEKVPAILAVSKRWWIRQETLFLKDQTKKKKKKKKTLPASLLILLSSFNNTLFIVVTGDKLDLWVFKGLQGLSVLKCGGHRTGAERSWPLCSDRLFREQHFLCPA